MSEPPSEEGGFHIQTALVGATLRYGILFPMLKRLEISGFKSFARKTVLDFSAAATSIVGPNGSGKSNVAEAFRFALGEQSMKSMRGKRSEDLIFAGSHSAPRANRAGVTIVFDNTPKATGRLFPKIDFDEVAVERAVYRSGESEYSINGSKVRLRDVQEMMAGANVGETGHHIISQGEADRILLSSPRDRRAMLEDALGLKAFEFRKSEAVRKLEKTQDNVQQVEALRREIAPTIRFLKKQVERLDHAESLRTELTRLYQDYFAREDRYVAHTKDVSTRERAAAAERLAAVEAKLKAFDERATRDLEGRKHVEAIRTAERELERQVSLRGGLARELGRVEGTLDAAKRRSARTAQDPYVKVARADLSSLREEAERQSAHGPEAGIEALHAALSSLGSMVRAFFERYTASDDFLPEEEQDVLALEAEQQELQKKEAALMLQVEEARAALMKAREDSIAYDEAGREERHQLIEYADSRAKEEGEVARLDGVLKQLTYRADELAREKSEALALVGVPAVSYAPVSADDEARAVQEDRRRMLERLKIRLEEAGGTGEDVRREYEETVAREAYLARELEDLAKSSAGLIFLIKDLDHELATTFGEGLKKVNESFTEYFGLMFGGGSAKLTLEEVTSLDDLEDEEGAGAGSLAGPAKAGIEIAVHLPKKRVQSLMQLSGGERALTSIALIFAMSQVNPPPFLILDETDAALDEANSRRYGDMIDALAKKSQLIVITHNRETMSRAGILYGVTMGNDGISKLLSIKFEEATAVAK